MKAKRRLVIVEDHTIVRQGLESLFHNCEDIEVLETAEDGFKAIRCIAKHKPDLILLDLNMPKMDGISVIREIKGRYSDLKILVLTMLRDEYYILNAFRSGAHGYCLKSASYQELLIAVKAVLNGKIYVSPDICDKVLEGYLSSRMYIREKASLDTFTNI